jgi:hypothetical protein
MARAGDTFVEAVDTTLASHTPTGPDAGAGWLISTGGMQVVAATDVCSETNDAIGNRSLMTTDLGSPNMVIEADFTLTDATYPGLLARRDSAGNGGVEAGYDNFVGQWEISDGTTSSTLTEAWPGGTVCMRFELNGTSFTLHANNILKVSLTSSVSNGNYAGIRLGNNTGTGTGKLTCDNYISYGITGASIAWITG